VLGAAASSSLDPNYQTITHRINMYTPSNKSLRFSHASGNNCCTLFAWRWHGINSSVYLGGEGIIISFIEDAEL